VVETLYARGREQGSLLIAELDICSVVLRDGAAASETASHGEWLVATQDCDLVRATEADNEAVVELRSVLRENPPRDWGIRSARFLLTEDPPRYLHSTSPRLLISPAALAALLGSGAYRENVLDPDQPPR
jgi:hypothetical protein